MCDTCLEEKHAGVIYGLHTGDYQFRYIGKSINHKVRYRTHLWEALRDRVDYPVYKWIRKHGAENIQMTIIRTFTEEDIEWIDEEETFHIAQARMMYEGNLNVTNGGDGVIGVAITPEHRAKISASMVGLVRSAETRKRMSEAAAGKKHSPEHKASISAALKNRPSTRKGIPLSAETKAKMSAARQAKPGLAGHTRYHTNQNIVKEGCIYCA